MFIDWKFYYLKMARLSQLINRYNPFQNLNCFFSYRNLLNDLKSQTKMMKSRITKTVLGKKKKNKVLWFKLPDFKTYYSSTVINTVWYWHKNKQKDHWLVIDNAYINPAFVVDWFFDEGAETIQWRKE